ncbi:tetratricopeptide repeat protein [Bacillus subtilis]|uniref:response regulator aspartate phosphatase n=1 Tax=Bacillus TaxID=1386 RepID=UPI00209B3217|nr:tetratricopeptide repeat protein [Bacillus subtilis]MCO8150936.1 tetratricopeptide repeat protein [Bacillus subtilis]
MNVIPSANVGVKINEWYDYINKFDAENADKLKTEITEMIESMEEDQDLLIYYQLMLFRHYLMMAYLYPSDASQKLEKWEYLKQSEGKSQKITRLMEYYANFFEGMYFFSEGDYISAIQCYKKAEKRLFKVRDQIEKAEFYYKMAEVFYHMKQTHVSMFYVQKAYEIYKKHDAYVIRKIHCLFVIAGNYVDLETHEHALPHIKNCLALARMIGNEPIITKALINMGLCYNKMNDPDTAADYFFQAADVAKKIRAKELTQAYYDLSLIYFKQGKTLPALENFERALESAKAFKDEFFMTLLNVIKTMFIENADRDSILLALEPLRNERGYPYLEELALDAAEFYTGKERMDDSVFFFRQMVDAQKQIQRGDFLYEI